MMFMTLCGFFFKHFIEKSPTTLNVIFQINKTIGEGEIDLIKKTLSSETIKLEFYNCSYLV